MKILHLDQNHPLLIQQLEKEGHTNVEGYQLSREEVLKRLHSFEGIVIRSRITVDREFIDAAPKLRFIARVGAGLESIDT
ncbi:MAG: hydroxyacid dehydrogenase, partial [Flavobacteriaceae bacterium]|nr:hydroxyacid dehydrogenase [Flavobacteriaceae bacterium]